VDGVWYPGELRAWSRPSNFGPWWGNVLYRVAPGKQHVATVREAGSGMALRHLEKTGHLAEVTEELNVSERLA
jgi:hypothetical protein